MTKRASMGKLLLAVLVAVCVVGASAVPADAAAKKPAKAKITKASSPSNGTLDVKWKKVKQAKGYQVRIGTNQKTTSGKQVKNLKTTKHTFKKLKPGKKYYVKVRAYKLSGKKKVYGSWSKVKSIEVKKTESSSSPTNPTKPTTGGGTAPTSPTQPTGGSTAPTNPTKPTTGGGGGTVIDNSMKLCSEIGHVGFISNVESTKFVVSQSQAFYVFFYKGADHDPNNPSMFAHTSYFKDQQHHIDNAMSHLTGEGKNKGALDSGYWGIVPDYSQFFMDRTELSGGSTKAVAVKVPVQGGKQTTERTCLFCGHKDNYDTTNCVHKWADSSEYGETAMGKALVAAGHKGVDSYNSQRYCIKCGVYE